MKKWRFTYQVEDLHSEERVNKEVIIEAEDEHEAELWADRKIVGPMVREDSPYIPFIYGSGKIEEVQ